MPTDNRWVAAVSIAAAIGGLLLPQAAEAQRRGAVIDFEGPRARQARRGAVVGAREELDLTPRADLRRTARQLGADLADPGGIGQVATELGLDVVVSGEVAGRGRDARTTVRVIGADGSELASREAAPPVGRRRLREIAEATAEVVREAIAELDRREEEERRAAIEAEEAALESGPIAPPAEEEVEEPSEPAPVPILEAMVGFGGRSRNADVLLDTGGSRVYESWLFPELSLRLSLRPFASSDGALRGLFVSAAGYLAVGLRSVDDMDNEIGTSALRLTAALGYVLDLDGLEVGPSLGFGYDAFSLDDNTIFPTTLYTWLRPGLVGRVPLLDELLHLQIDAGLRIGLGTGDLAPMFGESASAFGFDLMASLGGNVDGGFCYAARLGYQSYSLSFDGEAEMTDDTASGGTDASFVLVANVGWQLR